MNDFSALFYAVERLLAERQAETARADEAERLLESRVKQLSHVEGLLTESNKRADEAEKRAEAYRNVAVYFALPNIDGLTGAGKAVEEKLRLLTEGKSREGEDKSNG